MAKLTDSGLSATDLAAAVETVGITGVADGLLMDRDGNIHVTSPEDNALKRRAPDGTPSTLVQDPKLRWPDTLSQSADGAIYITTSRTQDMTQYYEKGSPWAGQPYALFRAAPACNG